MASERNELDAPKTIRFGIFTTRRRSMQVRGRTTLVKVAVILAIIISLSLSLSLVLTLCIYFLGIFIVV